MKRIFISYRRADSQTNTLSIRLRLQQESDLDIFQDITNIPDGYDFRDYLREGVAQCDVLLVIIGDKWLTVTDEYGKRRLDNPEDFVRIEIMAGLERRLDCLVLPIFVNGATALAQEHLPDALKALATLHSPQVRADGDFENDIQRILKSIREFAPGQRPPAYPTSQPPKTDFNPTRAVTDFYTAIGDQNSSAAEALLKQIERYKEQSPKRLLGFDIEDARQTLEALKHQIDREQEYHLLKTITATRQRRNLRKALRDFWQAYSFYDPDNLESLIPDLTSFERGVNGARHFTGTHNTDWTPIIVPLGEIIAGAKLPKMEMCLVPVGSFMMGSEDFEWEKPIHLQTIDKPYWIARYPVTNAQWRVAVDANAVKVPYDVEWYNDPKMADCPVVWVTWHQALAFAQWVGCTLPSELETEYAARGLDNLIYPWGNDWEDGKRAVWDGNREGAYPHPVTSRAKDEENGASWVGAMHLSGNVWEWQRSAYEAYPYNPDDGREDISIGNSKKVLRGGSFHGGQDGARSVFRGSYDPFGVDDSYGFRVCCCPHLLRL